MTLLPRAAFVFLKVLFADNSGSWVRYLTTCPHKLHRHAWSGIQGLWMHNSWLPFLVCLAEVSRLQSRRWYSWGWAEDRKGRRAERQWCSSVRMLQQCPKHLVQSTRHWSCFVLQRQILTVFICLFIFCFPPQWGHRGAYIIKTTVEAKRRREKGLLNTKQVIFIVSWSALD